MVETETTEQTAPSPASTLIEQAENLAKRIEEANKKTEELLKRQEEIQARQIVSGRSVAVQQTPTLTPEQQSDKEIYDKIMGCIKK